MSEAQSLVLTFDEPPRNQHAHTNRSDGDAPQTIAATLRAAGIDAPCSLYNEAIELARQGHLGQAVSRLQMLLGLDPDDADALLLLAKVHAAQGRPQDSLARLDAAVAAGVVAPAGFRDYLETAIRAERSREEEHRARLGAREQGEVKALRNEARQLRSENVRIETELGESRERERLWKYAAIGASGLGTTIILAMILASGGPSTTGASVAATTPTADVTEAGVTQAGGIQADATQAGAADASAAAPAPVAEKPVAEKPVAEKPAVAEKAPLADKTAADKSAAAKTNGPHTHVVASGDTLYKLASRYYGDSSQWEKIAKANKAKLKGKIDLKLGDTLVIP